jgi:hypothetical protein
MLLTTTTAGDLVNPCSWFRTLSPECLQQINHASQKSRRTRIDLWITDQVPLPKRKWLNLYDTVTIDTQINSKPNN